jgi:hypothetical protein
LVEPVTLTSIVAFVASTRAGRLRGAGFKISNNGLKATRRPAAAGLISSSATAAGADTKGEIRRLAGAIPLKGRANRIDPDVPTYDVPADERSRLRVLL